MASWNMYLEQIRHKKILLLIMYVAFFEDNYIFVDNFNTSSQSYQPIP